MESAEIETITLFNTILFIFKNWNQKSVIDPKGLYRSSKNLTASWINRDLKKKNHKFQSFNWLSS